VSGTAAITIGSAGLLGLAVALPFLTEDLAVAPSQAALLLPASYLGGLGTSFAGGVFADRRGGRSVAAFGLGIVALGVLLAGLAPNFGFYLLGAVITGSGYAIVNAATSVLVNSVMLSGRGLQLGVKQAGVTVGGLAVGITIPALEAWTGWSAALVGVSGAVAFAAAWMIRDHLRSPNLVTGASETPPEPAALRPFAGGIYGLAMSAAQVSTFGLLGVYLVDHLHASPTRASAVFGLVLVGGVVSRVGWGVVSDRSARGRVFPLRVCALMGFAGFVCMSVSETQWAIGAAVLLGIGTTGWNGAYLAAIMPAGSERSGRDVGHAQVFIILGCIVGPLLAGAVLEVFGRWDVMWGLLAASQVLALWVAKPAKQPAGAPYSAS